MPVQAHAEEFRSPGTGENAAVGVLLSHGFTGSPWSMKPFAEHLAAEGYGVAVPRLPGHGTSWQEMNKTSWPDWYAVLDNEFERLRKEHDQVFLVGLSMGGCLVLRLAEQHGADDKYEPLIDVPTGLTVEEKAEDDEEPPAKKADDPHDHFVPPEPPRAPRLDWISRIAWLGLIGGPLLLIAAALLDFGTGRITTLAVAGFIGGFLTLVFRMKDRLPPGDGGDDGAVV